MVRVKRGKTAHARRKRVLKQVKGFRWGRKSKYRLAKDALHHAWAYSYRDRKTKKRTVRRLWQTKINAATRSEGISYSIFTAQLKKQHIIIDRKILSQLAEKNPEIFQRILERTKSE
ncbi:50S ribosomal protein L20 [Patescibacteria group bacterium]|nr:50S ribosomal protein L20 [Patescibacteria group bacterium]